jgi:hypothetical protein
MVTTKLRVECNAGAEIGWNRAGHDYPRRSGGVVRDIPPLRPGKIGVGRCGKAQRRSTSIRRELRAAGWRCDSLRTIWAEGCSCGGAGARLFRSVLHLGPTVCRADGGLPRLRYDLFGRGWSDRPETRYDPDFYDQQLVQLLGALDIRGLVDLVGVSLGGPIAVNYGIQRE